MKKRAKPSETQEILEIVNFMKDRMATKGDIEELRKEMVTKAELKKELEPLKNSVDAVGSKVAGTNNRLDLEAMQRDRLQLPRRVSDLEVKNFGQSRHPKSVPL
ncbi:MAG: hypothetical protein AAB908_00015 [Patescibacteria group bacterium]